MTTNRGDMQSTAVMKRGQKQSSTAAVIQFVTLVPIPISVTKLAWIGSRFMLTGIIICANA